MNLRPLIVALAVLLGLSSASYGRWFDAERGQWLSRDQAGYVDGQNLYQYVGSQPIIQVDPTGLDPAPSCQPRPPYGNDPGTTYPDIQSKPGAPCRLQSNGGCGRMCRADAEGNRPFGGTQCVDTPDGKEKVCCVCDITINNDPRWIKLDPVRKGVTECAERHEQEHRDDQRGCFDEVDKPCCELSPTIHELQCLDQKKGECRTDDCKDAFDGRIRDLQKYYRDNWNKCFAHLNVQ